MEGGQNPSSVRTSAVMSACLSPHHTHRSSINKNTHLSEAKPLQRAGFPFAINYYEIFILEYFLVSFYTLQIVNKCTGKEGALLLQSRKLSEERSTVSLAPTKTDSTTTDAGQCPETKGKFIGLVNSDIAGLLKQFPGRRTDENNSSNSVGG